MSSSEALLPLIQLLRRDWNVSANARLQPVSGGVSSEILLIEDNVPLRVVKRALPTLRLADMWNASVSEDPMADTDVAGWQAITGELGASVQIVGDDLFTTNVERIQQGADRKLADAVLIKLNQVGTVSETLANLATAPLMPAPVLFADAANHNV